MKKISLPMVRRSIALAVIFLFFMIFSITDFPGREKITIAITSFQVIPALYKASLGGLAAIGMVGIIFAVTVLWGRVYCSFLCPLGILMDGVGLLRKKFIPTGYRFSKVTSWIRYALLAIVLIAGISGMIIPVLLLDPYSIFGRLNSDLVKPAVIGLTNAVAGLLANAGLYSVAGRQAPQWHGSLLAVSLGVLCLITVFVLLRGRLYCNTICPVGALLGLISRFSWTKIQIDSSRCTSCGACVSLCKAECIDIAAHRIDAERCVACFNCTDSCSFDALSFGHQAALPVKSAATPRGSEIHYTRRDVIGITAIIGTALVKEKVNAFAPAPRLSSVPVTPPGSVSIERFADRCTACHLCIVTCPSHVLQPRLAAYGSRGMFQPVMDFEAGFCEYDCVACTVICPTGAIGPLTAAQKKNIQLGKSHLVKEDCVVFKNGTACAACAEVCPTRAVTTVPYKGIYAPVVDNQYCVGCGACQKACPVAQPRKAIYVEGNAVHARAPLKPDFQDQLKLKPTKEDFPF